MSKRNQPINALFLKFHFDKASGQIEWDFILDTSSDSRVFLQRQS